MNPQLKLLLGSIVLIPILAFLIHSVFITSNSYRIPLSRISVHHLSQAYTKIFNQLHSTLTSSKPTMSSQISSSYTDEYKTALLAVQRASRLTRAVYVSASKGTLTKDDASPVTIGDFGAQALIIKAILTAFPTDKVIGEEDAQDLRANDSLRSAVWASVRAAEQSAATAASTATAAPEKVPEFKDEEELLAVIDRGNATGGRKGRVWALDPIDGTKGFLRGGQYAIALALLVDGVPVLGVLGCPNLPVSNTAVLDASIGHDQSGDGAGVGVLISAVRGLGFAESRPIDGTVDVEAERVAMRSVSLAEAVLCESVEAAHSNQGQAERIRRILGITGSSVRLDSQAKYASVARGAGDVYLRLPAGNKKYVEKIWDHAAGWIVVKEAGGEVTDVYGKQIDFGLGRFLEGNTGFVVASKDLHADVLKGVQKILEEEGKL